jgi:hypothetical protein
MKKQNLKAMNIRNKKNQKRAVKARANKHVKKQRLQERVNKRDNFIKQLQAAYFKSAMEKFEAEG